MKPETLHSTACPYCEAAMRPAVMDCPSCGVEVRGRFKRTMFELLNPDEREFLEEYLLAGFNIKALARGSGMGYTAIRNRLDKVIDHYREIRSRDAAKKAVLDRVAEGEVTAEEAAAIINDLYTG
ncbi:MAG: DUF2089 domain-containing protein [bacterium]|nr:DUF2089 domain-containing protein [bacterium]